MDLFDSLSKLTISSDENVPPVLDGDYKHSVLGKLYSMCVLAYALHVQNDACLCAANREYIHLNIV